MNGTLVWSGTDSGLSYGRARVGMYQDSSSGNELLVDGAPPCLPLASPPAGLQPAGGE